MVRSERRIERATRLQQTPGASLRKVTTALLFPIRPIRHRPVRFSRASNPILEPMKTTSLYLKTARSSSWHWQFWRPRKPSGDTYSWTNFQSDIAGVAQHIDENLVNPWGMAVSPNGTIWVSDNGTGVSTLYGQDGTARSLVVTIPYGAPETEEQGIPLESSSTARRSSRSRRMETSAPALFIFVSEDGSISGWNPNRGPDKRHYRR